MYFILQKNKHIQVHLWAVTGELSDQSMCILQSRGRRLTNVLVWAKKEEKKTKRILKH